MIPLHIIFFSNYSDPSLDFLDEIRGMNIKNTVEINIDSNEIRGMITNSTELVMERVPCLLIEQEDGSLDKYEGDAAFDWIDDIVKLNVRSDDTKPQGVKKKGGDLNSIASAMQKTREIDDSNISRPVF